MSSMFVYRSFFIYFLLLFILLILSICKALCPQIVTSYEALRRLAVAYNNIRSFIRQKRFTNTNSEQ